MNITRSNFSHCLPFILDCLNKSHFVAIDFEMTGLFSNRLIRNASLDTIQMRYWKTRENLKDFWPVQLGLCGFNIINKNNIEAYPFNFYMFPFAFDESAENCFAFQADTLLFLATHNFDFNKLFYDGIFSLSEEREKNLTQTKLKFFQDKINSLDTFVYDEMTDFVKTQTDVIKEYLIESTKNPDAHLEINIKHVNYRAYKYLELQIPKIFQTVSLSVEYDQEEVHLRKKMIIKRSLGSSISKVTSASVQAAKTGSDINLNSMNYAGLRQLFDLISTNKTPLVTHNGFLDILHVYDKLFRSLPESNIEFKKAFNTKFPNMFDTRYMITNSNTLTNEINTFPELQKSYSAIYNKNKDTVPFVQIHKDFHAYELTNVEESLCSHEAGFDALMTGYIFFKSLSLLGFDIADDKLLEKLDIFKNKIPLGNLKNSFEIDSDFVNREIEGDVFRIQAVNFSSLNMLTLKKCFKEKFGQVNVYFSSWEYEFFIVFQRTSDGKKFLEKLSESPVVDLEGTECIVEILSDYIKRLKYSVENSRKVTPMPEVLENI